MSQAQIAKRLAELSAMSVVVGIPSDKNARENEQGKSITNAQLGYIHEFGAPEANIPPRPFLKPAAKEFWKEKGKKEFKKAIQEAISGNMKAAVNYLERIGIEAVSAVKIKINSNVPPALSQATLANRQARGKVSEKTLVDTGQMRNSVTYEVRENQ